MQFIKIIALHKKPNPALRDESELIQLLLKRQVELNALLEITQAINFNRPASVLFEMFEVILSLQLKIGELRFLIKNGLNFYCAAHFGTEFKSDDAEQHLYQILGRFTDISPLSALQDSPLSHYEYFVPVFHNQELMAFVLIGKLEVSKDLLKNDLNFIQTLVSVIVVALENKKLIEERVENERIQRDIELAVEVQGMFIPSRLPKSGALMVGSTYLPNENIGGDYFDFIKLDVHEYLWCIADVSGKGVSAALLMAILQASLRAWTSVERDLVKITERLNQIIFSNTNGERFVTLFLGLYHTQNRELRYVNSGHHPSILIMDGEVKFLNTGSTLIGAFDTLPEIELGMEILTAGSLIFNYTDGLVESSNEDVYISDEELVAHVLESCHLEVDKLNENILRSIQSQHNAKMNSDDITLLTIRVS